MLEVIFKRDVGGYIQEGCWRLYSDVGGYIRMLEVIFRMLEVIFKKDVGGYIQEGCWRLYSDVGGYIPQLVQFPYCRAALACQLGPPNIAVATNAI